MIIQNYVAIFCIGLDRIIKFNFKNLKIKQNNKKKVTSNKMLFYFKKRQKSNFLYIKI